MTTLVELCAGSAAVSLRWLSPSGKPPIGYQGGKRAYADAILDAMGLAPGGGAREGRVVLVEAGPWGEAWALWRTAAGRRDTCERLRAWEREDPRALWERLCRAPVPSEVERRVATWAAVQFHGWGRKPVIAEDGNWRHHGFNESDAYRVERANERRAAGEHYDIGRNRRLPELIAALEALDLSRVEVHHADARTVEPIPGAHVYIDPDYEGTTGYGHTLPRPEVLALAKRHRAAGCVVAVSEAKPLPLDGWHYHRLPPPVGRGRTWSEQQAEWLTLSRPPAHRQASLFGAA